MYKNNLILKSNDGFPILGDKKFNTKISNIYIEISGKCNAKCPYCARQHFKHRYSGKNMDPALFEKILDHCYKIGLIDKDHNSIIYLYNWGEPFLNPGINDILTILKRKKLYAGISSNFIVKPQIHEENLSVIREIVFSLSGFSQDSYGKIHGATLKNVLNNFEDLYKKTLNYAPNAKIGIAWHRYKFNERELWKAYKYFDRQNIEFRPAVALLNDFFEMLSYYTEGKIAYERQRQAEKDLFLTHVLKDISYHKLRSNQYHCFQWKYIVIDENGKLLLCCSMTNNNVEHILGNVLEMSYEQIWQKKLSDSICIKCISSGLARSVSFGFDNIPLPPGDRGILYFKLLLQLNLPKITRIIKSLPGGRKIVQKAKKILTSHLRDTLKLISK